MEPINWTRTRIEPEDILDGVKSILELIPRGELWTHSFIPPDWQSAETLYGWAEAGMSNDNELGWDIAVSYAKRSVCRRIDGFLVNNWMKHFEKKKNPDKLDYLRQIGIPGRLRHDG